MVKRQYQTEREGQIEFYETFLPSIDCTLSVDDILDDNNDGVLNGNLLEFKLRIKDLNAVLFQSIKYLSQRRIKGKPCPGTILLVDLNTQVVYEYKSKDYLDDIEKVYSGGASKNNSGFVGKPYVRKYDYSDVMSIDVANLIKILRKTSWTKIHIDENCIVGWAEAYYRAKPHARKEDFIGDDTGKHKVQGEIRNPTEFKEYIEPYTGTTNVKFKYLMDKLNDTLLKKNLGAFYTPEFYAKKSHELLRKAIARVPDGNDYIILDRCAGTGALERDLTDDELSHCILSTVEYYEYKVLQELLADKVRYIIPPIETSDTFDAGLVRGADALSREYVENLVIKQYVDDDNCTIILFENPPYAEANGTTKTKGAWKNSYVVKQMKSKTKGRVTNELGNVFIWSAFEYYLRQDTDSYIVYSPIKYWKAQHLIKKKFLGGMAFNRRWFHTNIDACISVCLWSNEDDSITTTFSLDGYDYDEKSVGVMTPTVLSIYRVDSELSRYYDKRDDKTDTLDGIGCNLDGTERQTGIRVKTRYNNNIIGYLVANATGFDNPDLNSGLTRVGRYDSHGFFLRFDNYLEKLPMFCASRYITYNRVWTERARVMKSGDGVAKFNADVASGKFDAWLLKCLLFTCLEMQNHCRMFTGSDNRFYRNELCLDTTNGDTLASKDLAKLAKNDAEKQLIKQWETLLDAAKKCPEYDSSLTYGVYQIYAEIDMASRYKDVDGKWVYPNVEVHSALATLKKLVADYYNSEIVPTLFEYEFLK